MATGVATAMSLGVDMEGRRAQVLPIWLLRGGGMVGGGWLASVTGLWLVMRRLLLTWGGLAGTGGLTHIAPPPYTLCHHESLTSEQMLDNSYPVPFIFLHISKPSLTPVNNTKMSLCYIFSTSIPSC